MERFNDGFEPIGNTPEEEQEKQEMKLMAKAFLAHPDIRPMPDGSPVMNGTLIRAERDIPELDIKEGLIFPVLFDGTYIRGGNFDGPSWTSQKLRKEMHEDGLWSVVGELEEFAE